LIESEKEESGKSNVYKEIGQIFAGVLEGWVRPSYAARVTWAGVKKIKRWI